MVRKDPRTGTVDVGRLDGNAAAGMLGELFRIDVTAAVVTCRRCGTRGPFAEVIAELDDDGLIVLCRGCRHTLFTYVRGATGPVLSVEGLGAVEIPEAMS